MTEKHNLLKRREANRRWRSQPPNREKVRAASATWYKNNKAKALASRKAYYERNRSKIQEYERTPVARVRNYKVDARRCGRSWAIPDGLAIDLITDNCFYCGTAPAPLNGIDRVDSLAGYEEDNVVTACFTCNRAKSNQTRPHFEAWLKQAAKHVGLFYGD